MKWLIFLSFQCCTISLFTQSLIPIPTSHNRRKMKLLLKNATNWVLTSEQCSRLASWKYHSGTGTPLDSLLNIFWEWFVALLPMWMAPNLVTFLGFLAIASTSFILLSFSGWNFTVAAPTWVYSLALAGHFIYQTMDAIDGKQARRTKSSTPLGQLFDHGCDAFTTILVGILNASCMLYGRSFWTIGNTMLNFNVFWLAQWEEYHSGILNCNNGWIGLTEGQVSVDCAWRLDWRLIPLFNWGAVLTIFLFSSNSNPLHCRFCRCQ